MVLHLETLHSSLTVDYVDREIFSELSVTNVLKGRAAMLSIKQGGNIVKLDQIFKTQTRKLQ